MGPAFCVGTSEFFGKTRMDLGSNRRIPTQRPDDFRKLVDQEILGCEGRRASSQRSSEDAI